MQIFRRGGLVLGCFEVWRFILSGGWNTAEFDDEFAVFSCGRKNYLSFGVVFVAWEGLVACRNNSYSRCFSSWKCFNADVFVL